MFTKIGYARVSTKDQNLSLQIDALKNAGCEKIFQEKKSGAKRNRPELEKLLEQIRPNDVVVIWKLDRLARSTKDLINLVNEIQDKGAGLISLNDNIDTSSPQGKLIFHVFASLAEFERDVISERTKTGLTAARARGRVGGRKKGLSKQAEDKAVIADSLYKEGQLSIMDICNELQISKPTLYKYLRHRGARIGSQD